MKTYQLADRAEQFLHSCLERIQNLPSLYQLRNQLEDGLKVLGEPMRVAIVGTIKSGKSTFLNALLNQEIVPTAVEVMTYNVNWFHYSEKPSLVIHFKDGNEESRPFSDLAGLVKICLENKEFLDSIWWIDVFYPHPLLKFFDLIDTPGLESCYKDDSTKTKELLTSFQNRPHAVIFMIAGEFKNRDISQLDEFHEASGSIMSGITAIGALSKVDQLEADFEDANTIIRQNASRFPQTRRAFYKVLPISSKLYLAGQLISHTDVDAFHNLTQQPDEILEVLFADANLFVEFPMPEPTLDISSRENLLEKFDLFGIKMIVKAIREDPSITIEVLSQKLIDASGMTEMIHLIKNHFGNRATLLKLKIILDQLYDLSFELAQTYFDDNQSAAAEVCNWVNLFKNQEQAFREYHLLEDYYNGKLDISEQLLNDLLHVTGEFGITIWQKLDLPSTATLAEIRQKTEQKFSYWKAMISDPFSDFSVKEAARIIADSYEKLITL